MIFQWFLRGLTDDGGLTRADVEAILDEDGLRSAWLRSHRGSDPAQWADLVDDESLRWHVTRFVECGYQGAPAPFSQISPYISLSAGTVEPDHQAASNRITPAWLTALRFATDDGRTNGWVVSGYVSVLGRPAVPHLEFTEELRDLNQHVDYNPYHPEGELVAKLLVPAIRLEKAVRVEAADVAAYVSASPEELRITAATLNPIDSLSELLSDGSPRTIENGRFEPPERYCNIRGVL